MTQFRSYSPQFHPAATITGFVAIVRQGLFFCLHQPNAPKDSFTKTKGKEIYSSADKSAENLMVNYKRVQMRGALLFQTFVIFLVFGCSSVPGGRTKSAGPSNVEATVDVDQDSKSDFVAAGDSSQIGGTNLSQYDLTEPNIAEWSYVNLKTGALVPISQGVLSWPLSRDKLPSGRLIVLQIGPKGASEKEKKVVAIMGPFVPREGESGLISVFSTVSKTSQRAGNILNNILELDKGLISNQPLSASSLLTVARTAIAAETITTDKKLNDTWLASALVEYAKELQEAVPDANSRQLDQSDSLRQTLFSSELNQAKIELSAGASAAQSLFAGIRQSKGNKLTQPMADPAFYVNQYLQRLGVEDALRKAYFASSTKVVDNSAPFFDAIIRKNFVGVPTSSVLNLAIARSADSYNQSLAQENLESAVNSYVSPIVTYADNYAGQVAAGTAPPISTTPTLVDPSSLTAITSSSTQINLNWGVGTGATAYQISYNAGATAPATCDDGTVIPRSTVNSSTSYSVASLTTSTQYSFRVCSFNSSLGFSSGVTATATTSSGSTSHTIFVTSSGYPGNFGGLSAGDSICATRAIIAGLPGTWKALLSDGSTNVKDRILVNGPVYNNRPVGGGGKQLIATGGGSAAGQIWYGSIAVALNYTEFGGTIVGPYWTGSTEYGMGDGSYHCSNWTSTAASAQSGSPTDTNYLWFSNGLLPQPNCNSSLSLACIDGQ